MYKNMIPADLISRDRHPMEPTRCYAGRVDVNALEEHLKQHARNLQLEADFEHFKRRVAPSCENPQLERKEQ